MSEMSDLMTHFDYTYSGGSLYVTELKLLLACERAFNPALNGKPVIVLLVLPLTKNRA